MATSLGKAGACTLATTTKTIPQMRGLSPRWLLRMLPWVATEAGAYRVNRRLRYELDDGLVKFEQDGLVFTPIAATLTELPLLHGFADAGVLASLAGLFEQQEVAPGELIFEADTPMDRLVLLAHGRASEIGTGEYGEAIVLRTAGHGDAFGAELLDHQDHDWTVRLEAVTTCVILTISKAQLWALIDASPTLQAQLDAQLGIAMLPQDPHYQAEIAIAAGHPHESPLVGTFVDYEPAPLEIELSVAQAVLRVSTRVADLYSQPHDQLEQQLRLTIEALRERQEHELINNVEFGLLHGVDYKHHLFAQPGPPTPDDLDSLICRCRQAHFLLGHPRAIAAFERECTHRGIAPSTVELEGERVLGWRGIPFLPCDKLPISANQTSSILCMRVGEQREGVIGLHQPGIPDELEPSLNVRFMGIGGDAVASYLVSLYYSVAVLVPSALNLLEGVSVAPPD